MRETEVAVIFQPSGQTVYVLRGTSLLEAAAGADIVLDQPCGGAGTCGKCRVIVSGQVCEPTDAERNAFSDEQLRQGYRLGCQSSVCGPISVEVPQTSLLASRHKILVQGEAALQQAVDFEPGDTTAGESFAVAVDLGTTTLVAALLDLSAAVEPAVVSRLNPQTRFGDDVLTRILYCQENADGIGKLQQTVVGAIDEMIGELVGHAGIRREQICELTFSGNTTMQHLLGGVDPESLGRMPFVPAVTHGEWIDARQLDVDINPRGRAYVMPVIGGFVGGDTVSGILATGLAETEGPTLLVDIGTNGEIVLWAAGQLTAASTAAGPAFEGARISHGMRGSNGAIEKVVIDGRLRINVIGNVPPVGLCGSGLIDAAAELLRHKVLTPQGRLLEPDELPDGVPADLTERLIQHDGRPAFMIASRQETGTGGPIVLTQRDLRELQLATGAIRAGIHLLLQRAGIEPEQLESVLIAGGFGNFIRRSNAQRIGLMPPRVEHSRIRYQGNTSLTGARLAALSRRARAMAEDIARRTEHVDLSRATDFQTVFADAMIFP